MPRLKWVGMLIFAILLGACRASNVSPEATATLAPAFASSGARTGGVPSSTAEVPRISPEELKSLLDRRENVVVVDTRDRESYRRGHLPGAGHIFPSEIETRYRELPKGPQIVLY
jgi:hypothetical protein